MRMGILGFVGGVACLQTRAVLPAYPALSLAATVLVCGFLVFIARRRNPLPRAGLALLFGAACGFFWAALLAQSALAPQLAKADEGRDLTLIGTIDSLPYVFAQGVRFNFAVEKVVGGGATVPPKISLSWYSGFRDEVVAVGDVQPGERWQLTVRLQRPHGNANPMGFDYEVWLLEQGLRATGYVRPDQGANGNHRVDSFVLGFGNLVERCRATLRERIIRVLADKKYAGVIVALVVGDQRSIDQSDWTVFNRTGIGHLISISGLHITMIAGLFALIASSLWRRSFFSDLQLPLILPAQKVAALTGAAVALLYVLLAGFGVPAQRTLYMLSVVATALWLGRITSVSHVLCTSLGVVVLLDPWAVLWPGFWLSFGAVATILYATVGRTVARRDPAQTRGRRLWQEFQLGAHTQYVVTVGLVPLTMLLFSQISLVSPLANAVAIPLISLVVTPLSLAGSLLPAPLSTLLLNLAHAIVVVLAQVLQWMAAQPLAIWSAPTPPPWVFCWALIGTLWMLAPRGWPRRWLGAVSWIPLLTALPARPPEGQLWVTAFDVGQGMALLIETQSHRLLYDTGPLYSPGSDGGNRVILPYLKARGIDTLDGMIVTHSDSDHAGGALSILANLRVGWLSSSLWPDNPIVRAAPVHGRCEAGQGWVWDGVRFEMLHPLPASYADAALKPNARGCTLRISAGGRAILLAADIEAPQEAQLLDRARGQLRADVLLAPHHGSGTSSTPAFLIAVHPELALFQLGYRNRYHHPKAEVYERYREMGIARLRTDESGALTVALGPQLTVGEYRTEHARYWYGR
ncbi:MAG TPA: DNA internalization-related competence protein ComEC/Rec2 [Janthinobacterium sp.]|nr:DNA internalization-related competence protein ComEC/Rec2 [Janthinobacterium sp.]